MNNVKESLIGRKCKGLTLESNVKTLAIKIYDEQLPQGWDATKEKIIKCDKSKYHILAIKHDKDYTRDDFFKPSIEKPHYHIIIRILSKNGVHVRTLLNMLEIKFRPEDTTLIANHGLETVGDFAKYACYLTHDTEKAIKDGKEHYDEAEIVSNLNSDEIKQVKEGYSRLSSADKKASLDDMIALDNEAKKIGHELKDFDEWYDSLPLIVRANAKMKQIKESYLRGVAQRVEENDSLTRLCVFINGGANAGKTYNTIQALKAMGLTRILTVGGGGSGKFDNLKPSTEAIVVDDDVMPNLLNMTDNKMCQAYKRNQSNPWWCGTLVIVTSNLSFEEWLEKCKIHTQKIKNGMTFKTEHCKAMHSRFYECELHEIDGYKLVCTSPSRRGSKEEQLIRKDMYLRFRNEFNKSIENYKPSDNKITYDDINDYSEINPFYDIKSLDD